ncbi:hypothetical protein ACH5RR_019196 [Cinchona calisaya]|uniref:DDE Tnp4 domain-containing protein n=1 Tax=Cinchona calisaya TaxID=153742 RepID=A0ABD2ZRI6_9GENT
MAPIRGQRRKQNAEEEQVDRSAPPVFMQLPPCPSPDWEGFSQRRLYCAFYGQETSVTFESIFKLSRKTFNYICDLVQDEMLTRATNYVDLDGNALSLIDRVAIALRRLSSGDSLTIVGDFLGVNKSTVSYVTWCFVEAMEKKARSHIKWPSDEEHMTDIKSKFEKIQGLPNCCGVIDTTNIRFCQSSRDPTKQVWLDKENNASMAIQAIVSPDMRFLNVVTGYPGSFSDYLLLENSTFCNQSEEGKVLNGKNFKLSDEAELREYIIGDAGFPLLPWLITPFRGKKLSEAERDFNERHHETWMVAQAALTKLKQTWEVINGTMWVPDKHKLPRIIQACCLLHNIMIDRNDAGRQLGTSISTDHNPGYKQQKCYFVDKNASAQRENLARYLYEKSAAKE